jgi:DNA-directed RNA polymerase subunit K/omega
MLIAKRIRQLHHGAAPLVLRQEGESHFSVAVREIAEGLLGLEAASKTPEADSGETATETPQPVENVS